MKPTARVNIDTTAEDLRAAHVTLLADLGKLQAVLDDPACDQRDRLLGRLRETLEHTEAHFRFEEHNGYMEVLRKREPHLTRIIDALAHEHRELSDALSVLIAEVEARPALESAGAAKVRAWMRQLRDHERRENELVQDTLNRDMAAED